MNRVGIKTLVYHGDTFLGEAEVFPVANRPFRFPNNEIRISHLSPPSERCLPHAVLQTISPFSVKCKIQAKGATDHSQFHHLYLSCFQELKAAVVILASEELHLVAMPSRLEKFPCFWCFSVPVGRYVPCLSMLNPRCLAIVFDLDETLIVANTMKSFEDRIEALSNRIDAENDPVRVSGMSAELKRYLEDKAVLKQYIENDSVSDNGKMVNVQNEDVPPVSVNHNPVLRPIIRLQERNIVLTRINPEIRDTSVLVRLRPAWEELRSYLTAKGRKRFEVYVCTMAERDYALEMWRLLDPEAHLISSNQLLERIVCVKSGSKKSLETVFQDGSCHPKMSMVIDDRLKVWEDKDQPRVHVVPAFTPYYAPQAETANIVPVLCVARNVACNVRGAFFKEFDDNLLRKIFDLFYEDDILGLPFPPDTSDYLMTEDACAVVNGNKDVPMCEGICGDPNEKKVNISEDGLVQQRPDDGMCMNQACNSNKNFSSESESVRSSLPMVLQEIGRKCDAKIEFKPTMCGNNDFQFSVEVLFSTEKIGSGIGRTKKEAELQAANNALHSLANLYMEFIAPGDGLLGTHLDELFLKKENGFLEDEASHALDVSYKKEDLVDSSTAEQSFLEESHRLASLISGIKELLCMSEGLNLVFQDQPPASITLNKGEYYSQVEATGQILGKAICLSKEGAKLQAAEDALKSLKVAVDHQSLKRVHSPRLSPVVSTKRSRDEVEG